MLQTWLNHQAANRVSRAVVEGWGSMFGMLSLNAQRNLAFRLFLIFKKLSPAWGREHQHWVKELLR